MPLFSNYPGISREVVEELHTYISETLNRKIKIAIERKLEEGLQEKIDLAVRGEFEKIMIVKMGKS